MLLISRAMLFYSSDTVAHGYLINQVFTTARFIFLYKYHIIAMGKTFLKKHCSMLCCLSDLLLKNPACLGVFVLAAGQDRTAHFNADNGIGVARTALRSWRQIVIILCEAKREMKMDCAAPSLIRMQNEAKICQA